MEEINNKNGELEIMEFIVGDNHYGINIAKVREIVQYDEPTPSPDQHPCVEGILMLRGAPIPIINLAKRLSCREPESTDRNLIIITSFNNLVIGLHVHSINGIKKLSWRDIDSPDETLTRNGHCIITGIIHKGENILILLDFEKIVADINPVTTIQVKDVKKTVSDNIKDLPILIVDDSMMLNNLICASLSKAGFTNIISKVNGQEAWDYIDSIEEKNNLREHVAIVISDIEMPVMDGLTLCRTIKQNPVAGILPVILFSSIIDDSMRRKGEAAGANRQLSKPEIGKLVDIIEDYLK